MSTTGRVGVDVGGTFTDAVVVCGERFGVGKVPTTADQSVGVLAAIAEALRHAGCQASDIGQFAHSTTTATNALLEGAVARTALVTTAGFGDLLQLRRQNRASLYRLGTHHPPPVVRDSDVIEVNERMGPSGVLLPLSDDEVARVVAAVANLDVEAVAVAFLFSFANPEHELRVAAALREALPHLRISVSAEVSPTVREYERFSTTAVDAALAPILGRYLEALTGRARAEGLPEPTIMQSNGGRLYLAEAASHAVWTVLSGPAAGVIGAAALAEQSGVADALTLDMGGTSADVAIISSGRVQRRQETTIGGHAVSLPVLDITAVSAGGGSVAWIDPGGALRVGPRSAGARPGPAAYGLGGDEPTLTDANVVLGRLPPQLGDIVLDVSRARDVVGRLGAGMQLTVEACAEAMLAIGVAQMARALRLVSVERGTDPRGLTLVAFGGAGPLHAAQVADQLAMSRVLVPAAAGGLAALGLVLAGQRRDLVQSVLLLAEADVALADAAKALGTRAEAQLPGASRRWAADCRYVGQRHELTTPWAQAPGVTGLGDAFRALHRERFGGGADDRPIEVVSIRVVAERPGHPPPIVAQEAVDLGPGPQCLALPGSTVWVPKGWSGRRDAVGGIWLEREG